MDALFLRTSVTTRRRPALRNGLLVTAWLIPPLSSASRSAPNGPPVTTSGIRTVPSRASNTRKAKRVVVVRTIMARTVLPGSRERASMICGTPQRRASTPTSSAHLRLRAAAVGAGTTLPTSMRPCRLRGQRRRRRKAVARRIAGQGRRMLTTSRLLRGARAAGRGQKRARCEPIPPPIFLRMPRAAYTVPRSQPGLTEPIIMLRIAMDLALHPHDAPPMNPTSLLTHSKLRQRTTKLEWLIPIPCSYLRYSSCDISLCFRISIPSAINFTWKCQSECS